MEHFYVGSGDFVLEIVCATEAGFCTFHVYFPSRTAASGTETDLLDDIVTRAIGDEVWRWVQVQRGAGVRIKLNTVIAMVVK